MKRGYYLILFLGSLLFSEPTFSQDQWTQKANFGGAGRHRCTGFSIGNKGYIGGGHINSGTSTYHEDYWQYDPGTDSWTQIADFGGGKRYHSTAFTIDGFGYVGMGEDDEDNYHNDFYRYIPQLNIWQIITPYPGNPRRGASSFVIEGLGYVGCGQSHFGYQNDFYRYNPDENQWYLISSFLGEARSSAVGFSHNGKGYIGTGHIFGDDTKDFYEYDPNTDNWVQKADVGITNRQDATGFVVNGYAYIGTGNDVDGNFNFKDFWKYDFELDEWTQLNDFSGEARRYMVSFVIGETAYAGTGTDGTNLRDFWSFEPYLKVAENEINITVFPNPSTDYLSIKIAQKEFELKVFNLQGRLLLQKKCFDNSIIRKEEIGSGTFVYLVNYNGINHVDKFEIL
ncbi:MAG: T9SS type A sorting domain-containing protein [Crocinitomicaceae bacterium]|nr:T9SS type A sorting domain-containing protein [Crocinitomicaceae bacterium]